MIMKSFPCYFCALHVAAWLAMTVAVALPAAAQAQPTIVSTIPELGEMDVSPNAPVVFTFSTAMDTAATSAQFVNSAVFPPAFLTIVATWNAAGTRLTNTPTPPFPGSTPIGWLVFGQDAAGNELSGTVSGIFMTRDEGGGGEPPTLVSTFPADSATNIPTNAPVVFTFSTAMNTDLTEAQFIDPWSPFTPLPVVASWTADLTELTCTPNPPFPADKTIVWTLNGEDLAGNTLEANGGSFTTVSAGGGAATNSAIAGLLSRGGRVEQVDTNLFDTRGWEFVALADVGSSNSASITLPLPNGRTVALQSTDLGDTLEFSGTDASDSAFVTNHPSGLYAFNLTTPAGASTASLNVGDGPLPPELHMANWKTPPHVVLGQAWSLQWGSAPGGVAVDYVRVRIEQDGFVRFATPLPDAAGALTGASNTLVVPAAAFTNAGRAKVSLTAFRFTALDTNSITGGRLRTARHRTTTLELRIVDGAVPPPVLLTTNVAGVATDEFFLNPLLTTNGVRPLRFELTGGALPPGLALAPGGSLTGFPTAEGTFDATVRLTDLLDRSSIHPLRVVTVPLPPGSIAPRLENAGVAAGPVFRFDVLASAGMEYTVERSQNLSNWTACLITNAVTDRMFLSIPITSAAAFFRVRAPGSGSPLPPPNPLTVSPTLNANVAVSMELDELGGTLSLTNAEGYVFNLIVPLAALDRRETITMTDVAQIGGLPLSGGLRAAVELQPEGLPFNEPARLDITAPDPLNDATTLGFGARTDGSQFALQPSYNTNRTVSLYLWHFSLAGAGNGTAGDAHAQAQNAPDDPMAALAQQVAAALQACKADPNCTLASKQYELFRLYLQTADQVVLPKLKAAVADDAALDDALRVWLNWLREMMLVGLYDGGLLGSDQTGELENRVRRAGNLAAQAIRNGMEKACQRCLEHEIWRLYRMAELTRWAGLLGLNYEEAFWSCARKCLVFELEVESEIISSDGGVTYSTHTKGKAELRPKTSAGDDPGAIDMVRLMLLFEGSDKWNITQLQHTAPGGCAVLAAPAAGRLNFPWVKIDLYKKRQNWVPGEGIVTSYVLDPDMTVMLRSGLPPMPQEQRRMICPPAPAAAVPDIFGPMFNAFHNHEVVIPDGAGAALIDGPAFRMTGFVPGGPDDVILSKPYGQTLGESVENTLIQLRHTPGQ
jgi:hypothetical protein